MTQFADHVITLARNDSIKGIIITGTGRSFCTGGDLRWASSYSGGPSAAFHELSSRFHQSITEIRNMKKPVVSAINRIAAGGEFSLAHACDFRIMSEGASMKQGYTSNGLCIDGGGTYSLARLVGIARSMEIVAFDESIPSEKALEFGIVNMVVNDDEAMNEVFRFVKSISGPP